MRLVPEVDPSALAELFGRDPAAHSYGLADLEEPFWSQARWYRRGAAAVGVLELAGADVAIVYSVSPADPEGTADLLGDLATDGALPARCFWTGSRGGLRVLDPAYEVVWCHPHSRLVLADPDRLVPSTSPSVALGPGDLAAMEELFRAAPDPARFFTPSMLASGHYIGRRSEPTGGLVAIAGVHVCSPRFGVAAIGNVVTHPDHRRRGHAAELVSDVSRRLLATVPIVTLNVSDDNDVAARLYARLGFVAAVDFDEAELVAR
jgi:ribosomal protein S18 acetylase RimI-like enzyme